MKVDLPTLGMPHSITSCFGTAHTAVLAAFQQARQFFFNGNLYRIGTAFCLALMATQPASAARKYLIHSSVTAGSARSALFSAYSFGLRA